MYLHGVVTPGCVVHC